MKLSRLFLGALLASALLCAPAFAQTTNVTVIDFGADDQAAFGGAGANTPFAELIDSSDPAPIAVAFENAGATPFSNGTPIGLLGGATLTWTNVTAWNNTGAGANAGANYFAHTAANDASPTTFSIITANANDLVTVEAIGGGNTDGTIGRDALLDYGGAAAVDLDGYVIGTPWTLIGTSVGSSGGTLAVSDSGDEGNVGAFRVTITTAAVPEPSSLAILGLAGFASLVVRRRK